MKQTTYRGLAAWVCCGLLALTLAGCGDDDAASVPAAATATITATSTATTTATSTQTLTRTPQPSATPTWTAIPGCESPIVAAAEPLCALDSATVPCEFLNTGNCLLPYPSSYFLKTDASTPTGYKMNYVRESMPANVRGVHINPVEWNTLDGFSPGSMIVALFPTGVDTTASATASVTNFQRSLDADSPTILIDAETGEHIIHFTELDAQAMEVATRAFIIRPGIRLKNAHRYIVAIRHLKNDAGASIQPSRAFQILRDQLNTPVQAINARRGHFEDIFTRLGNANVTRNDLVIAWDFVTASDEAITGRMLSIREQAIAANGPGAPPFTVTQVEDNVNENIARRVTGTFTVPNFMTKTTPPATYNLDANGLPVQNGTMEATFIANIPRVALEGADPQPARPMVYGHGLLGSPSEVNSGHLQQLSNRYNFVAAGTYFIGLSEGDVTNTLRLIGDFSNFRQLPDRLQQAFLNFIFLGRLMNSANGFNSHAAFQVNGHGVLNTQEVFYYGNSQGGVEGGPVVALSPDIKRGVLGVVGANYSTLLQRSIDFNPFSFAANQAYPDELNRVLIFPLIQQLWDRGEPNGYMHHIVSNPFPGNPLKKVLLQIGVNDSQVSPIAAGIQVRSLGIPAVAPTVYPVFGVPEIAAPFDGSAFVAYNVGGTANPLTNTPPAFENGVHGAVRKLAETQAQIDAFLRTDGRVENFCTGPDGACIFTSVPGVQ